MWADLLLRPRLGTINLCGEEGKDTAARSPADGGGGVGGQHHAAPDACFLAEQACQRLLAFKISCLKMVFGAAIAFVRWE